jgi:hypothetical protein
MKVVKGLCIDIMCRDTTIIIVNFSLLTFYSLFQHHISFESWFLPHHHFYFFLIGLFVTPPHTHVCIVLALHFCPSILCFLHCQLVIFPLHLSQLTPLTHYISCMFIHCSIITSCSSFKSCFTCVPLCGDFSFYVFLFKGKPLLVSGCLLIFACVLHNI